MVAHKGIYIGTRGAEKWFKGHAPGSASPSVGWSNTLADMNGGVFVSSSRGTHKEYALNWPTVTPEESQFVQEMYYGLGGSVANELIYWLDPMAKNALPSRWSAPAIAAAGDRPLYGLTRPTTVATAANTLGYPRRSAVISAIGPAAARQTLYIPIPAGYTALIGVHGVADAVGILSVQPVKGRSSVGAASLVATTAVTSTTRYTKTVAGTASVGGIVLTLCPGETVGGTAASASGTIASIEVEVLPTGEAPAGTTFVLGKGSGGCVMPNFPTVVPLMAVKGRQRESVAATLIEVVQ